MNLVRWQSKTTNMSFEFYTLITFIAMLYQLNYEASLEVGQVLISIIIIITIIFFPSFFFFADFAL